MKLVGKNIEKSSTKVMADLEHLKKLFIMPDSPDKFIEFGTELLDVIHSFFKEKGGIHSAISIPELAKIFSDINIPEAPHLLKDVMGEIKNKITAHSVKVGNPYYVGHMTSAIPYFMILLEMIITSLNQNQVKIESAKASTFVEKEIIAWMHRLIYNLHPKFYRTNIQNRETALGTVTLDGTLANLTALLVARNKAFPPDKDFPGIRRAGVHGAHQYYNVSRTVVLVSKRGHYSIDKAIRIIGIGDDNVIKVPVDSKNRMDIIELEKICNEIQDYNKVNKLKIKIMAIVGIAGTTETGNIDNLKEIARVARKNKTHFHVDAAWGGAVLMVDDYRYLFNGIDRADSVSIDAHKLLYCPVSMGIVCFKNGDDLHNLKHTSNYIIREDSVDLGRFTVEGSRPFSALKPWATFKIFGRDGFRLLFEHAFDLTSVLRGLVEIHCNFEPMNTPELFIFNYRFVPKIIQERLQKLKLEIEKIVLKKGEENRDREEKIKIIGKINSLLNDLNIELHKAIRDEDNSFVSRTMIDNPLYYYQDTVILRAITINPLTTPEILKEILEEQHQLGLKIYKSEFQNRLEKI